MSTEGKQSRAATSLMLSFGEHYSLEWLFRASCFAVGLLVLRFCLTSCFRNCGLGANLLLERV